MCVYSDFWQKANPKLNRRHTSKIISRFTSSSGIDFPKKTFSVMIEISENVIHVHNLSTQGLLLQCFNNILTLLLKTGKPKIRL